MIRNKGIVSEMIGIESYDAESIEEKVRRLMENKEPINDATQLIYTERKDGVQPSYNIRTDRFELAVDAMDSIHKSTIAKREAKVVEMNKKEDDGKPESIQGTSGEPGK